MTPGIVLGILSMIVLLLAVVARYGGKLGGGWRGTYVVTAVLAQFFNFFALVVQSFEKIPGVARAGADGEGDAAEGGAGADTGLVYCAGGGGVPEVSGGGGLRSGLKPGRGWLMVSW